jgi:hypothetical protein
LDQPDNANDPHRTNKPSSPGYYEIRIRGQLDSNWSDWFNGLEVTPQENGETVIGGTLPDQAALHGILTKIFNLRLVLLSVRRIEAEA